MRTQVLLLAMALGLGMAAAHAHPTASEPAATAKDESAPAATAPEDAKPEAEATAKADDKKELRLPPGFKKVQRGKFTLYCKRDAPLGTRFKTDTCYDEAQMRDYIAAQAQNKGDIDRIRSTCSNFCVCGGDC